MRRSNEFQSRALAPAGVFEALLLRLIDRFISFARRYPNATIACCIGLICASLGLATGFWLLFRLFYIVVFAVCGFYLWTRSMVRRLEVDLTRRTHSVVQGQSLEGRIIIRSSSWLPKLWLEIEDRSSVTFHGSRRIVTLAPRGIVSWTYSIPTRVRGIYELGPLSVVATDPFGFFRMSRVFGGTSSILVYPNAPELRDFYIPPANQPGEGRFRRRTQNVTPMVSDIREYSPGDSYNRIHWPATARIGRPMVKQFELDPASDIWIILDLQSSSHVGDSEDGTEEASIQICASIARYFTSANRSVGLISFGDSLRIEEANRGENHYTRILEALTRARASGDVPLKNLIAEESRRFGRHTTVVVVTPSTDNEWVFTLGHLSARGVKVASVLLEASSYGPAADSFDVYESLLAAGVFTYKITYGEDLVQALSISSRPDFQNETRA